MEAISKQATPLNVFIIMLCFASNSVITRYLVQGNYVQPFPLTIIRFLSGVAMLLLIAASTSQTFPNSPLSKRHLLGGVLLGAYAFAISFGYVFISAAAGALVFYFFVVFSMSTYSVLKEKEPLSRKLVLGQILGILGVLTITFSRIGSVSPSGVLLMALTGTSWGAYSVYGRQFGNAFDYTYNSFLSFSLIAIALIIASLPLLGTSQWTNISPSSLLLALFMGTIRTATTKTSTRKIVS